MTSWTRTILFVCQFNSARSQLAEALAGSLAPAGTRILSAGLTRTVVNDEVLRALIEIGLDGSRQWSKSLLEIADEPVDVVVALAAEARQPTRDAFPDAMHLDWSLPDPIAAANVAQVAQAVRRVRDEIHQRLKDWFQEENTHA